MTDPADTPPGSPEAREQARNLRRARLAAALFMVAIAAVPAALGRIDASPLHLGALAVHFALIIALWIGVGRYARRLDTPAR